MSSFGHDISKRASIVVNLEGDDLSTVPEKPINASTNIAGIAQELADDGAVMEDLTNSPITNNPLEPAKEMSTNYKSPSPVSMVLRSGARKGSIQKDSTSPKATGNDHDTVYAPKTLSDPVINQDIELLKLRELSILLSARTPEKSFASLVTLFGRWRKTSKLDEITEHHRVARNPWELRGRILSLLDNQETLKHPKCELTDVLERLRTDWLWKIENEDMIKCGYDILKHMPEPLSPEDMLQVNVSKNMRKKLKKMLRNKTRERDVEKPAEQFHKDLNPVPHESNSVCSEPECNGALSRNGQQTTKENKTAADDDCSADSKSDGGLTSPPAQIAASPLKRTHSSARSALETDKLALKRRRIEVKAELKNLEMKVAEKERIQKYELKKRQLKIEAEAQERYKENMVTFSSLLFKFAKSLNQNYGGRAQSSG